MYKLYCISCRQSWSSFVNPTLFRTLYWRTSHDTLELTEISLNHNLAGGRVRFKFVDTPLLPGVSVHESWGQVGP